MTKVSQRQKDLLADFMSENYLILFGKFSGGQGKNVKSKKWDEITKILNENGPPSKEVEKWKRVRFFNYYHYDYKSVLVSFKTIKTMFLFRHGLTLKWL